MGVPNEGPFGDYTDITEVISAAAKTAIQTELNKLKALIPDASKATVAGDTTDTYGYYDGVSAAKPGFDSIDPAQGEIIRDEIDAFFAAVNAAPTS